MNILNKYKHEIEACVCVCALCIDGEYGNVGDPLFPSFRRLLRLLFCLGFFSHSEGKA